jgi:hypothetical protein
MADTLVALVTGQQVADELPIEIQVIITDRALLHGDTTPAHIPGYGPVLPLDDPLLRHRAPPGPAIHHRPLPDHEISIDLDHWHAPPRRAATSALEKHLAALIAS